MSDDAHLRAAKEMARFDALPDDVRAIARETDCVDTAMYLSLSPDPWDELAILMVYEQKKYEMDITDIMAGRE